MAEGRPLSECELTQDDFLQILGEYRVGASDVEIKAIVCEKRGSFSNDLWDRWLEDEEEFSETIKMGKMLSEAWWSKKGRTELENREFSFTGWYMNMKNRFGWQDKQQIDHSGAIDGDRQVIVLPSNDMEFEEDTE